MVFITAPQNHAKMGRPQVTKLIFFIYKPGLQSGAE